MMKFWPSTVRFKFVWKYISLVRNENSIKTDAFEISLQSGHMSKLRKNSTSSNDFSPATKDNVSRRQK